MNREIRLISIHDAKIDLFESQYPVPDGITYNSYIIDAPIPTVIEGVDEAYAAEWMRQVESGLKGGKPLLIVSLHAEPDHSGALERAMRHWPDVKIIGTRRCLDILGLFFEDPSLLEGRSQAVAEGDTLDLGNGHILHFITAPMVHWPEVAMAWEEKCGALFSADAFGTFGRSDTPGIPENWAGEGARYYFNVCGKYGVQVRAALAKIKALPGPVTHICPLHGPVLSHELDCYYTYYELWSNYRPDLEGVVVAYASIHGNTARAAEVLAEMIRSEGAEAYLFDLARCDMSGVLASAFRHRALALCASSYDGDVFPAMAEFIHHLALKGYRNRRVGLLQNGIWAPSALRAMKGRLEAMPGVEIVSPEVTIRSRLHEADLPALEQLARALAEPGGVL